MELKQKLIDRGRGNPYIAAMRFAWGVFAYLILLVSPLAWASGSAKANPKAENLYIPAAVGPELPPEQSQADMDFFWKRIRENPQDFESLGDVPMVDHFNRRAAEIWERLVACNGQDFSRLRQNYLNGQLCTSESEAPEIRADYISLREEIRGWLPTSLFLSSRDPKFGDLSLLNPLKNYSIEVYQDKYGYNIYMKQHVLWVQVLLEIAATSALYAGLDDAEYKRLLAVYRKSRDENYQKYIQEMRAGNTWYSPLKNHLSSEMYSSNRLLYTTLKIFGYLSPMHCYERGFFPEVAAVVTEGWQPLLEALFNPEFGEGLTREQGHNSVWMDLSCRTPTFLQGVSEKSSGRVKKNALVKFHSVVKLYRRLDQMYSFDKGVQQ